MSRSNLETIEQGYDAFVRGDLEGVLAVVSPEVEAYDYELIVGERFYRGHEGLVQMIAASLEGLEDIRWHVDSITEIGDHVLVEARRSGRGQASQVPVEEQQYHVWKVKDGLATRFRLFLSREDALAAARADD